MASIGVDLEQVDLFLTKGRDFRWNFVHLNEATNDPEAFPSGSLFFEFDTSPVTQWIFSISGSEASLKVESDEVDSIPARTRWQLVFLPAGEAAGGDPIARGTVQVQA